LVSEISSFNLCFSDVIIVSILTFEQCKSQKRFIEYQNVPIKCHRFQELNFVHPRPIYFSISSFDPQVHSVYQERGSFTRGNVVKRSKSSTKQNICRLMADITMSRLAVNTTRLPSFFPGPKILYTKSSSAGEIFIRRTTRKTCRKGSKYFNLRYFLLNIYLKSFLE